MSPEERDALIEVLHVLVVLAFRNCGDQDKVELLSTWRESRDVLCAERCSNDPPT
jgi:hypothetical protein